MAQRANRKRNVGNRVWRDEKVGEVGGSFREGGPILCQPFPATPTSNRTPSVYGRRT